MTNEKDSGAQLPAKALLRICRCNALVVGINGCPHCGAGWAESLTPMTEYSSPGVLVAARTEERESALRDAIVLVDTAPLCHCAGKQYIDPAALIQRMNAALEDAVENRKGEG